MYFQNERTIELPNMIIFRVMPAEDDLADPGNSLNDHFWFLLFLSDLDDSQQKLIYDFAKHKFKLHAL